MSTIEEAVPEADPAAPIDGTWATPFYLTLPKACELRPKGPALQQMQLSLPSLAWLIRRKNHGWKRALEGPIAPAGIRAAFRTTQQAGIV